MPASDKRLLGACGGAALLLTLGATASQFRQHDGWLYSTLTGRQSQSQISGSLYNAGLALDGERGGRTYAEFDQLRREYPSGAFRGFDCLGSCAGHEAGYRWADDNGITGPRDCGGNSWAFTEGCVAYARDNAPERDEPQEDMAPM